MAAPLIDLNKNQILLTAAPSALSIDISSVGGLMFGEVARVNDLEGRYEVGQIVLFDPKGNTSLVYSGDTYFIVTQDKIFFNEQPPV